MGERWLIHGMNHFWSGGSSDPRWKDFTDPKGPSGAEASWRFLSRHTKSDTGMPCAETPCPRRKLSLRLPAGTVRAGATVGGVRVASRVKRGRLRLTLPAGVRERTVVKISARKASGRRIVRRPAYPRCGPA